MDAIPFNQDAPGTPPATPAGRAYRLYRQTVAPEGAAGDVPALALRAQAGDLAARDALYALLEARLRCLAAPAFRWARAAADGRVEPADVQQELFLCFCTLLRDWQPARAPFLVFLGTVFPRRMRHYVRGARRPREVSGRDPRVLTGDSMEPDAGSGPALAVAPDPALTFAGQAACAALLDPLPPLARRLLVLYVLDGRPMAEVARHLGLPQRTAWRLYAAACATLRTAVRSE